MKRPLFKKENSKSLILPLTAGLILCAVFLLQTKIDDERSTWSHEEELLYIPSGKVLKIVSLGFDEVMADILYIRMLDYFGTHATSDRTYTWLYHMADLVTTLDPKFRFPYIFAGLMLNLEANQHENARKIIIKGMNEFPNDWYFPFVLGINYFFHDGDFKDAADSIEKASRLPKSPAYLKDLALKLRREGATRETAIAFLQHLYVNFKDKELRKILAARIREIKAGGGDYE
ncbi:MAG: hypothetical protein JW984_04620 [Deltaproteobacteria bacterium]|uniref:Tetratricopeptide repeat protein n=1 Tax=Candidatus Zymogenus saltonus TaxID=2844893 RepID=A0A9D8PNC4_9DELT|nr:hypothetical protein [Candidatus Zymogenus saltonus]